MEPVPLPADLLALMERGVSVIVGSRDAQLRPSVVRAVGSRIEGGGSAVTVYLSRPQSRQVLQDIAANGHVAAVFSEPSTHKTVQLKATRAALRTADAGDRPHLDRYLASMEHEIELVGHARELTRAMLACELEEVVAVTFRPEHAFDQTPGPRAGAPLGGGR
ncbi:hypothetical protein [Ramlibacter sp.]|uniref:hypothetical protein n=1 Tax=Ramlibacter sp. TaxID=1917967 RepID=UPI002C2CA082|nr:hypothetical protein [Ramlibacter sp.]HWI84130.1 hypothetical protein [Ramlibacter sp.]